MIAFRRYRKEQILISIKTCSLEVAAFPAGNFIRNEQVITLHKSAVANLVRYRYPVATHG